MKKETKYIIYHYKIDNSALLRRYLITHHYPGDWIF